MTYAIFKAAGFQYRAELGAVLRLPSLKAESGEKVTFDEVLMGASDGETLIGQPTLKGAKVQAEVIKHGRADKVIVFKFKRRKNYRKKTGHRQNFTEIRVSEIDLGGDHKVSLEEEKKAQAEAKKTAEKAKKDAAEKKSAKKPAAEKKSAKKPAAEKKSAKKPAAEKKGAKKPAAEKKTASKKGGTKSSAKKTTKKTESKKGGKSASGSKKKTGSKSKKKES